MWLFVCACLNELKNAIGWKSPPAPETITDPPIAGAPSLWMWIHQWGQVLLGAWRREIL